MRTHKAQHAITPPHHHYYRSINSTSSRNPHAPHLQLTEWEVDGGRDLVLLEGQVEEGRRGRQLVQRAGRAKVRDGGGVLARGKDGGRGHGAGVARIGTEKCSEVDSRCGVVRTDDRGGL